MARGGYATALVITADVDSLSVLLAADLDNDGDLNVHEG